MTLKQQVISELLTRTGTLNTAIIRRDWFKQSDLYKQILAATTSLGSDDIGEQVYAIVNDILGSPVCPVCGEKLRFKMFKHGYPNTCNKSTCKRENRGEWKSCSETKILNHSKTLSDFLEIFRTKSYEKKDDSEISAFIEARRKQTDDGRLHQLIDDSFLRDSRDVLCCILEKTAEVLPVDPGWYNWSERFYLCCTGMVVGKCLVCGKPSPYISLVKGYQTTCSIACSNSGYSQKCNVESHFASIRPAIENQGFDVILPEKYEGLNAGRLTMRCRICGEIMDKDLSDGKWKNINCHGCNGRNGRSGEETAVYEYVASIYDGPKERNHLIDRDGRSSKELDIYMPDINLAVEYDGIYWHSEGEDPDDRSRIRHLEKTRSCEKKGISLLHIFSNEWTNPAKRKIWESMLSSRLRRNSTIYARSCEIVSPDTKQKNDFLDANHLQGRDSSSIAYGLQHEGSLVALMSFSGSRFTDDYEWEMVRYCNRNGMTVVGGASRLLAKFRRDKEPKSLITYADRRYSTGDLYKKLRFTLLRETPPGYFYVKGQDLLSRMAAQKHRLPKLLGPSFDPSLSEADNMFRAGWRRIWDCGHLAFGMTT